MLREIAFANSIALVTALFFLLFYAGSIIAPNSFRFLRNFFRKYRPSLDLPASKYHVDGAWALSGERVDANARF